MSYPNNWYINCFPSMASESVNVNVTVKTLSGDLIELSVDPALGLDGVEAALTAFDSDTYAPFQFRCFFIDEEVTELTHDAILGLIFVEEPMARLEEIQENITLPGIEAIFKLFKFKLSSSQPFYVYVRRCPNFYIYYWSFSLMTIPEDVHDRSSSLNSFSFTMTHTLHLSIPDAYIISQILRNFLTDKEDIIFAFKNQSIYCECGHIVKSTYMTQHLNSKFKHNNGDTKGKVFLARVTTYIESLELK